MARDLAEPGERVAQQGRFVAVAGSGDERRNDVAVAVAQGHYLVAFQMFVAAVTEVVAAFLRGRRRPIAVNDRQIKQLVMMEPAHRARKDGIHATICKPAAHRAVDTRIVNFGATCGIPFDRQHLPLTAHVQHLQDVVEDLVQGQRRRRSAPAPAQIRQDKLLELLQAQFRWNHLPAWVPGHRCVQKSGLYLIWLHRSEIQS